ncbi:ABC transporter permease [Micromonospora echinofusca]|uniref:ABC transporter permease n=1 Tax=Micromonospora echinofusca TaxID=47858 RepID=A0ABS3VRK4_MICEH|nr:ABC transporter permease [Micromonospora echinofusca]MBO4207135.1 ABC transporter permease [Micromonospora echinofusca]
MRELLIGARMAVTGGRDGWTRALLTALGVGIGVAMLLLAAAVPGALDARQARGDARDDLRLGEPVPAAADTLLVAPLETEFRGRPVRGRLLRPEGPQAPVPPGLTALPRAGEAVVSPALKKVLDSPDGDLFRPRLGGATVTGTIGAQGLAGPHELAFYLGTDSLTDGQAVRLDAFGGGLPGEELGPVLILLVVVIFVVLLLPIAVFLGTAVRFGGERRDRRLAALRLVGADTAMTRRIAAGEAAAGALLGVVVGAALFALARQVAPLVSLWDISVYAADVRPAPALVAVIVLGVPLVAVLVGLIALRGVLIEPLGVTRRAVAPRRRLWWRLILPVTGLALLYPLIGGIRDGGRADYQVAAGVTLLLIGSVALLPWLVDLTVRRLRGGPVGWQLAIRRLQLDSATSARLVNGIAVAVAGTIALQMLFATVEDESTRSTGQDTTRAQAAVQLAPRVDAPAALARLRATPGLGHSTGTLWALATPDRPASTAPSLLVDLRIGDCAALAEYARLGSCTDGDVFLVQGPPDAPPVDAFTPGTRLRVGDGGQEGAGATWSLPTTMPTVPAREDPFGGIQGAILATPAALPLTALGPLGVDFFATFDRTAPDALEHLRNAGASIDRFASVTSMSATTENNRFTNIRRGLYIGATLTLLLIGTSMLVGLLEQLRERRRLLAMLVAVGTRRTTLAWSVFWQAAVPVVIGLALATGFGIALGAVLLRMVGTSVSVDWSVVGLATGLAAAVVLLAVGLGLPALWRLLRADGLRTD